MNSYVSSSYYKSNIWLDCDSSRKGVIFQEESWADKTMDNIAGGVGKGGL